MKTLRQLLEQLTKRNLVEADEENYPFKYKSEDPKQKERTRFVARAEREKAEKQEKSAKKADVEEKSKQAKEEQGKASKWGIPYITKLASDDKIASVTVKDAEDDGKIWMHQGKLHFRHPSGKTHNDITLQSSGMGIAIMPKAKPGQKVVKAIAHLPASRDALVDDDFQVAGMKLAKK